MPSTPEINRIKVQASGYAKSFLANKYRQEYEELYDAYLLNRGLTPRRATRNIVDERELLKENQK